MPKRPLALFVLCFGVVVLSGAIVLVTADTWLPEPGPPLLGVRDLFLIWVLVLLEGPVLAAVSALHQRIERVRRDARGRRRSDPGIRGHQRPLLALLRRRGGGPPASGGVRDLQDPAPDPGAADGPRRTAVVIDGISRQVDGRLGSRSR